MQTPIGYPRNRLEAREGALEILRQHNGPGILTLAEATNQAARESTLFVRRESLFANGSGPGVDVYQYSPVLGRHSLIACLTDDVARAIHGAHTVLASLPHGVVAWD